MAKTIDLKIYKENKEIIKNLKIINDFFIEKYPEKSAGWVGLTALFYSQTAIANYLNNSKEVNKGFVPALKAVLWNFLNEISSYDINRKDK